MKTLAILTLLCAPALAGAPCVTRAKNVVVQNHAAQVFTHQNYAQAVVLQQVVPAYYSVGYAVQAQALEERARRGAREEFRTEIATLRAMIKQLQGDKALPPDTHPGLAVLQQSCVKCHKPDSKPVVNGSAPALFDADGNLTATDKQIGSMLTTAKNGIMPPQPADPLTDDDYLALKQYLSGQAK